MTEEEWVGIADFLDNAFTSTQATVFGEAREDTYRRVLIGYPAEAVQAALLKLVMKGQDRLPGIGKIIENIEVEPRMTWAEGWQIIQRALKHFGYEGERAGLPALERRARLCAVFVQEQGWRRLWRVNLEDEKTLRNLEWQWKALVERDEEEMIAVKAITAASRVALPHKLNLQRALEAGPTEGGS